jgi:hypothetical protein
VRTASLVAAGAIILGSVAVWVYHAAGLTLSHYDAKAHLVVARRVLDSLTPGWRQLGAVWLPLPHLLNLLPVQIDTFYRTGASGVAISVLSFGLLAYACARVILRLTDSSPAAVAGTLIVVLNPDLLYLQATPMTEPLLLALTMLAVALLVEWVDDQTRSTRRNTGLAFAAACLTRYEAWPVTAAALVIATLALWRKGLAPHVAVRRVAVLAAYPLVAVLAFLVQSRLTVGHWFVTGGFYVVDNPDMGRPLKTIGSIWWASHHLNGYGVLLTAVAGAAVIAVTGLMIPARAATLIVLALGATAALPWYAFVIGHPFRIRYMIPLVPAVAVWAGVAAGRMGRYRTVAAVALVALVLIETRPFDPAAPMIAEAQLDREHGREREAVTEYLARHRHGEKLLVSLGSLSHYVQELSSAGLRIRDVIHEGNGDLWAAALRHPETHVGWILVEELSEGGDQLSKRAKADPSFLTGFARVAEGGGVGLYRRQEPEFRSETRESRIQNRQPGGEQRTLR